MTRATFPRFFCHSGDIVRTVTASAVGLVIVGMSSTVGYADSVSFLNTPLPVDTVVDVDETHVKITLGGEEFVTVKDLAGSRVANVYARQPVLARKLPWSAFTTLAATAGAGADGEFAKAAVHGAFASTELSEDEVTELIATITDSPSGRKLVADELATQTAPAREQSVCVALTYMREDAERIKSLVQSSLGWMQERCPMVLQRACQKVFQAGDAETAQRYLDAMSAFFPAGIPAVDAAKVASERLRGSEEAFRSGNFEKFESSLRVISMDPILKDGFSIVAPTMTLAFAQKQLEAQRAGLALRSVASLDFSLRSNAHHEVLSKILAAITVDDVSVFSAPAVQKALWSYASKDEAIKSAYIQLLSSLIREIASTPRADMGVVLLSNLRELRPDPSVDNNALRVVLGEALLKQGRREVGSKLLAEAGVSESASVKWMGFAVPLFVGIVGALVAQAIMRRRRTAHGATKQEEAPSNTIHDADDVEGSNEGRGARNFVSYTRNPAHVQELSEYEELLGKFSLQVGATSSDIKLAYRNAVKSYHPDLNPHGGQKEADMFISITKIYERLLELHQERGKRGG